jgi:hypothetical protein
MISMTEHRIVRGTLALLVAGALCGTASAQEVGKASAVNPAATANMRTITIGSSIVHKERIQTQSGGSVQLLFLDKTSMTIGPNSDLTIDEYVYDPTGNAGKITATLGKGALRFVGGQISHNGDAQIKTANAVIGIRGGTAFISPEHVYAAYGVATVNSGGTSVPLGTGEFTGTEGGANPPTPPGPPPAGFVAALIQNFQSSGKQTGGTAPGSVSQARVAAAEARATGSSKGTVAAVAHVNANGTVHVRTSMRTAPRLSSTSHQNSIVTSVIQSLHASSQSAAVVRRKFGAMPYALTMTNCCSPTARNSPVPYLPQGFATGNNYYISPLLGYRTASVGVPNRAPFFQVGIGITGVGAAQSSWFMVATGALLDDRNGRFVLSGGFGATRRGAANLGVGRASASISSVQGSVAVDGFSSPTAANVTEAYYIPESRKYVAQPATFFLGNGTASQTYGFMQNANRSPNPAGLGDNRPTVVLSGWAAGLMRTSNITTGEFLAPSFAVGGPAAINLDPNLNKMQANFSIANRTPTVNDTFSFGNYQIGTVNPSLRSRGIYVDYNNFAARDAVTVTNTSTGATNPISTVNNQQLTGHVAFLANVPKPVAQQISSGLGGGINFCQCDYTRWGFWSNDNYRTNANGNVIADRGNLMSWVAGRLPSMNEVPINGTATYDGHVIASIKNGANEYVAAGNFTNSVNFGTRTVAVTVTGLDNTNYAGTGAISSSDPRNFTGSLFGSIGSRNMALNGQFFRGVSGPVAEMGGGVQISGTTYIGGGIFAAKAR